MNISNNQYAELAKFILDESKDKKAAKEGVVKLAKLIVENRDQGGFERIVKQFNNLIEKEAGVVNVNIVSAKELSSKQEKLLQESIAKKLDIKKDLIEIFKEVDESLIGGISIQIGAKVIDGSLRAKIEKLENSLL
ncbi:ATP synthase F1 subunit delta [bacterium]|jgi:F-type H+-transporting ATPase subunit delta|nr:ATP synthase F1 subunit delta [bacterium]MBT4251113.1 ATP synthase F1 subunit delta [bacterium]MBT4598095.1 ATP synthase F1 subunit delta [bacterium]MBT6753437.1 ATP synthase F1 subunit delta [bacterium]MBT7038150.1 ATP synthase F1 subunit delta [bacterium]